MNWFSMLFHVDFFIKIIVTTLACFVTICLHENNWHVLPKCLFQKNFTHKLSFYMTYLLNEQFKMFLHFTFLRITMITDRTVVQSFLHMNWLSMFFQIDFFIKIIVTTLACFVTSCPHENNWHVFSKCLFQKNT